MKLFILVTSLLCAVYAQDPVNASRLTIANQDTWNITPFQITNTSANKNLTLKVGTNGVGFDFNSMYYSFGLSGAERFKIDNSGVYTSGNIQFKGIAGGNKYIFTDETSTGTGMLHIQAGAGSAGYGGATTYYAHNHATKPGWVQVGISANSGATGTSNEGRFTINTHGLGTGTDIFTVLRSGNVGIGTTTPNSKLQVNGNISLGLRLDNLNRFIGKPEGVGSFGGNSNWIGFKSTATEDYITFGTHKSGVSGGERMRIDAIGNVGIGTINPQSNLHVESNNAKFRISNPGNANVFQLGLWDGTNARIESADRDLLLTTYNNKSIKFGASGSTQMIVNANGNVGIGTTTPSGNLHIRNENASTFLDIETTSTINNEIRFKYNGTTKGFVWSRANGAQMAIGGGSTNNSMFLNTSDGNVGIGTATPESKLAVNGTITAKKIKITANIVGGADFVFEDDYDLKPLEEVESFIKENKHLPEIPSAKDMKENGLDMSEFQIKLLQKIEELTLHTIRQEKEMAEMKKAAKKDRTTIQLLSSELNALKAAN